MSQKTYRAAAIGRNHQGPRQVAALDHAGRALDVAAGDDDDGTADIARLEVGGAVEIEPRRELRLAVVACGQFGDAGDKAVAGSRHGGGHAQAGDGHVAEA